MELCFFQHCVILPFQHCFFIKLIYPPVYYLDVPKLLLFTNHKSLYIQNSITYSILQSQFDYT